MIHRLPQTQMREEDWKVQAESESEPVVDMKGDRIQQVPESEPVKPDKPPTPALTEDVIGQENQDERQMLPGKDMIGHWIDSARHMPPGQGNQDARQMLPGKDMIGHWIGSARHMPPGQGMIDTKDDTKVKIWSGKKLLFKCVETHPE